MLVTRIMRNKIKLVHHSFHYQDLYMSWNVIPAEVGILNYLDKKKKSSVWVSD